MVSEFEMKYKPQIIPDNVRYDYDYPNDLDLRPNAKDGLHQKLLPKIMSRAMMSHNAMAARFDRWREIDKQNTGYIYTDEEEAKIRALDPRKPISVVVPIIWAAKETLMTYLTEAFLEYPYFKYQGSGPEDKIGAMKLEKCIDMQTRYPAMGLDIYSAHANSLDYGIGVSVPSWFEELGIQTTRRPANSFLEAFMENEEEQVLWEGSRLQTRRPYDFLPDPAVSIHNIQDGEYIGWIESTNLHALLRAERTDETLFNVKYLKEIVAKSIFSTDESNMNRDGIPEIIYPEANPITLVTMIIDLLPDDWHLSNKSFPQKWIFTIANDSVIIRCQPMALNHNQYPVVAAAPDFDGHSISPISRLELVLGMQEIYNFYINSHVHNIRKVLHDMFVVDPSVINMADLLHPAPGKIIRTRRAMWGKNVTESISQLKVQDVTQTNMQDASALNDMVQRVTGAVDMIQGIVRQSSERRSATEMGGIQQGALSRLRKCALLIDLQYMQPLARMLAENTKQFMEHSTFARIIGRYEDDLRREFPGQEFMRITPDDIQVRYDILSSSGRVSRTGEAQTALMAMQIAQNDPEIRQLYSIPQLFACVARLAGFDNLGDYIKAGGGNIDNVQTMTPEQLDQNLQAGNIRPLGEENARREAVPEQYRSIPEISTGSTVEGS